MSEVNWGGVILILCITAIIIVGILSEANGEQLPCIIYSDGKIAVISNDMFWRNGTSFYEKYVDCTFPNNVETIEWFLANGYHIADVSEYFSPLGDHTDGRVWMTR